MMVATKESRLCLPLL